MEALFIGSESFLISVHAKSLLRQYWPRYKWRWICHNALCSTKPGVESQLHALLTSALDTN